MNTTHYGNLVSKLIFDSSNYPSYWRKNITDGEGGELTIDMVNSRPNDAIISHLWNGKVRVYGSKEGQLLVALARYNDEDGKDWWTPYHIGRVVKNHGNLNGPGYSIEIAHEYDDLLGRVLFHHVNKARGKALVARFRTLGKQIDLELTKYLDEPCICEESLKALKSDFVL
jgi:hypothetical protein